MKLNMFYRNNNFIYYLDTAIIGMYGGIAIFLKVQWVFKNIMCAQILK